MKRTMLKSKIHRATVTEANLEYEGSITIDTDLMEAADMLPYEQVDVLDLHQRHPAADLRDRGRARHRARSASTARRPT